MKHYNTLSITFSLFVKVQSQQSNRNNTVTNYNKTMASQSSQICQKYPKNGKQTSGMEILIEPIKMKAFNFLMQEPSSSLTHRSHGRTIRQLKSQRTQISNWKPIIRTKRLMDEPKLIMSLEKKKARIISALRNKHVDSSFCGKSVGSMTGSKLKNQCSRLSSHRSVGQTGGVFDGSEVVPNFSTRRKKKIPFMNVSLKYFVKHGIRDIDRSSKYEKHRQKGSNSVYYNLYSTEYVTANKKMANERDRPRTSIETNREQGTPNRKAAIRPQSVFYK